MLLLIVNMEVFFNPHLLIMILFWYDLNIKAMYQSIHRKLEIVHVSVI